MNLENKRGEGRATGGRLLYKPLGVTEEARRSNEKQSVDYKIRM